MAEYTIEIDCAPGAMRPGDLLPGVLKGTPLQVEDLELASTFFGNWTWVVKTEAVARYKEAKPMLKQKLEALYDSGACRYASW